MAEKNPMTKEQMMASAPIPQLLLKLALPAVAAQFINLLYNIVDRIYIGNMPEVGALALTGVGVTFPIILLVSAFSAFAGMGAAPLASIQLGAGNREEADHILGNAFTLILISAAVLTVGFSLFKTPILYAFGASDNIIRYASDYISVYLVGTVFVQIALGLNAFISAQGQANVAMLSVLIGAVINIVLDPVLIFGLNMGVRGAALATILSQAVSALWVLRFLCSKKSVIRIRKKNLRLKKAIVGKIAALGVAPFIMQSTESLVNITLNTGLQRYGGDLYVGSLTIMQSVMQMIMLPMQGLMQGAQPIMSFNYGAKNNRRVIETFKLFLKIAVSVCVLACLITTLFPTVLGRMFTQDEALLALVRQYLPLFFGGIWAFGLQMACQTTFMGLGQAKISTFLALLRKVLLLIPLALILPRLLGGVMGIYLAEPIADIVASATSITLFLLNYKKLLPTDEA